MDKNFEKEVNKLLDINSKFMEARAKVNAAGVSELPPHYSYLSHLKSKMEKSNKKLNKACEKFDFLGYEILSKDIMGYIKDTHSFALCRSNIDEEERADLYQYINNKNMMALVKE